MRKTRLLATVCMAALLCGCGRSENDVGASTTVSAESKNVQSVGSNAESGEDISYAAMIPNVEDAFPDGTVTVIDSDGGTRYCVQVKGYKDGEYEKYVEGCKSMGFSDVGVNINNDTVNKFEAYSSDNKYFISLQLLKDEQQVLNITCGKRKNNQ